MPEINCKICGNKFYAKNFHLKRGWAKCCSSVCRNLSLRNGKYIQCEICKKDSYKSVGQLKHSKSGKFFCSKSCQTRWRNTQYVGEKHTGWINGETTYRKVLRKALIPQFCTLCKVEDKRILAVHHIDEDKKNYKLENLAWLCHNCHRLVHCDKVEKKKFKLEHEKVRKLNF